MIDIDQLHELIIESSDRHKTFTEHLDLWKKFYNNRFLLFRLNISNPKLFVVIIFLLEEEHGEIFDYFHSDLLELLQREQMGLAIGIRDSKKKAPEDVSHLLENLDHHSEVSEVLGKIDIDDEFGAKRNYLSRQVELYTVDSLMMVIYEKFFELEPETVKHLLEFITRKIISFQKDDNVARDDMNGDALFLYFTRILPIKIFIGDDLSGEELIKRIKTHQLKNKKLILKLFKESSIEIIFRIFEWDLNDILVFITEVDYISEVEKQQIVNRLCDDMLESNYVRVLLGLIAANNQNPFWRRYLDSNKHRQIIINSLKIPITYLKDDMILYLIKQLFSRRDFNSDAEFKYYATLRINMIYQCKYLINKGARLDYDLEALKGGLLPESSIYFPPTTEEQLSINPNDSLQEQADKLKEKYARGLDVNINIALNVLDAFLAGKVQLSPNAARAIIRSVATFLMKTTNVEDNGVYFYYSQNENGSLITCSNVSSIAISNSLVKAFFNPNLPLCDRLKIFETLPHEIKHGLISQRKKNNIWSIEEYEMSKEDYVSEYDPQFYTTNYKKYREEIHARISGANVMSKFFERFLPKYLNQIQDEKIRTLEAEKHLLSEQNSNRVMAFFRNVNARFHTGFDALVRYNPSILEEQPIFKLEYHLDGTPKTYEEICQGKTGDNDDLIDGILRARFPDEATSQVLNPGPKK